jgi:acyl-CoA thioester hydrolase
MPEYRFYYPIQVRYGDLDPQWHVNNARFLTFFEQARISYLMNLGLFDGHSFFDLGLIVADTHIAYKAPILLDQKVQVGVRIASIGTKSLRVECQMEDVDTQEVLSTAEFIMVAYDYHVQSSKPVPAEWRQKMAAFDGLPT